MKTISRSSPACSICRWLPALRREGEYELFEEEPKSCALHRSVPRRRLYQSRDLGRVEIAEYLKGLANGLFAT